MIARRRSLALLPAALAAPVPALAQGGAWPQRPVRLVVPFAAGTTTDFFGRAVGQRMAEEFGQPVVVENRAGAGGNIGAASVARERDGHTLLLGTSGTHGVNASLFRDQGFDPLRDFAPAAPLVTTSVVLAVRPQLGPRDVQGLLELARRRTLTFASAGSGTTGHLSQALVNLRGGVRTEHVPYRDGSQAVLDLLAGRVDAMFYHFLGLRGHLAEGTLAALGATGARRMAALPDLPTMQEQGLRDFVVEGWWGLYLPAAAPREAVERVSAAANSWLRLPATAEALAARGVEALGGTPADLAARTAAEVGRWGDVVRAAGLEPG